jgi:hypothetical protein
MAAITTTGTSNPVGGVITWAGAVRAGTIRRGPQALRSAGAAILGHFGRHALADGHFTVIGLGRRAWRAA